jgi:hypothetical protein
LQTATADLLKPLNIVEQEPQLILRVRLLVVLILLGVGVWICLLVEEYNIEQEHALEQIALHTLRLTQGPVVNHSVTLGVAGLVTQMLNQDLGHALDQTVAHTQKQSKGVELKAKLTVVLVAGLGLLDEPVLLQL